ncbi:MAG: hypothetical protein IPP68_06925 [Elusimicrobia bacterium]|nr:hypothetical protein [Elusimicrobiota bacterium]
MSRLPKRPGFWRRGALALLVFTLGAGRRPHRLTPREWTALKESGAYHTGEGWAEIHGDRGAAREEAQNRALADLSRHLRVAVRASVIDRLGQSAGRTEERLESRVESYTELVLKQPLDRREIFLNWPKGGVLTAVVALSKARYAAAVDADLEAKKEGLLALYRAGRTAEDGGRPADALRAYGRARRDARAALDGLPLRLSDDESGQDFVGALERRTDALLSQWTLDCGDAGRAYDGDGASVNVPIRLRSTAGAPPAPNDFPLRAFWTHRPRRPAARARTDGRGAATLSVPLDAFVDNPRLRVEPDWDELNFLPPPPGPACEASFHPRRALRFSVIAERADGAERLAGELTRVLGALPWTVDRATVNFPGEVLGATARSDFGLEVRCAEKWQKHPTAEFYFVRLSGAARLYDFRENRWVFRESLPEERGDGASTDTARNAAWNRWAPAVAARLREKSAALP